MVRAGGTTPFPNLVNIKKTDGFHFRVVLSTLTGALKCINKNRAKVLGKDAKLFCVMLLGHVAWFSTVLRTSLTMNCNTFSCINCSLYICSILLPASLRNSHLLTRVNNAEPCSTAFTRPINGVNYKLSIRSLLSVTEAPLLL